MKRMGYAIRTTGDAEIAGALANGIEQGTLASVRRRGDEAIRRVAMARHTPEEWAQMIEDARVIYGGRRYAPGWARALLVGWALVWCGVLWVFRLQDRIL